MDLFGRRVALCVCRVAFTGVEGLSFGEVVSNLGMPVVHRAKEVFQVREVLLGRCHYEIDSDCSLLMRIVCIVGIAICVDEGKGMLVWRPDPHALYTRGDANVDA